MAFLAASDLAIACESESPGDRSRIRDSQSEDVFLQNSAGLSNSLRYSSIEFLLILGYLYYPHIS